jgi:signal transduction histidine kinase
MNRRLLIQVTAPAVLIGLALFGVCLASAWSIGRLQTNFAHVLKRNVASLEAAQELEIMLRQLRFHSFVNIMDPTPERQKFIEDDQTGFEHALDHAREAAATWRDRELLRTIEEGYARYRRELAEKPPTLAGGRIDYVRWADAHPVRYLQEPCQRLLRVNKEEMEQSARTSEAVSEQAQRAMLWFGLLGPAAGLAGGYGIARILSRSLARLSVQIHDVHASLEQNVGLVHVAADSDIPALDRTLRRIVPRVQEVVEQLQQREREVLRSEQLAAVGQLAASVAHEVRNPLTGIKLLVESGMRGRPETNLTRADLGVIRDEITRLETTVQMLLDFARPAPAARSACDLGALVRQAVDLIRSRARALRVRIESELPEATLNAEVDPHQLKTLVLNLFLNALDAMPAGGVLRVRLEQDAGGIRLAVADTGPGIAPEVAPRLFTPFASTKPTGTGLGLSICRRIAVEHGGTIHARNRPEGGAVFEVVLPLAA